MSAMEQPTPNEAFRSLLRGELYTEINGYPLIYKTTSVVLYSNTL